MFDTSTLKNLTLSGRFKCGEKSVISKDKKDILEAIFNQRLAYLPRKEVNENRQKKLNKLIRYVIDNANKKKTDIAQT